MAAHLRVSSVVLAAALAVLTGCLDRPLTPIKSCVTEGFVASLQQDTVTKVDVLFLVDNSGSMEAEQTSLRRELPNLVRTLATGVRRDGSAFTPVADLHVAVVTSDLGVGPTGQAPNCSLQGDDAIMRSEAESGCGTSSSRFLSFRTDEHPDLATDAAALGEQFGCIAHVGIAGCGIEQQLDSVLKALTPASNGAISFQGNTHGHGSDLNEGFLREDSLVAVILVTDEDDCSATPEGAQAVYDEGSTIFPDDRTHSLNNRCQLHADAVAYSVDRYVSGLRALRPQHEERVVFAAITGVPADLVADAEHVNYDALLNDSRMQVEPYVDSRGIISVHPACEGTGGSAAPARRIVETAQRFGANGIVQSICQDDFGPALEAIINKIASFLDRVCLPRALNPDENGQVQCDVIQQLPSFELPHDGPVHCADVVGVDPTPLRITNGREECRMTQVDVVDDVVQTGEGWYYDNFSDAVRQHCRLTTTPQRIAFTPAAIPVNGAQVHLECLQRVQSTGSASGNIDIGTFCDPTASADMCAGSVVGGLFCEASTRTCQIACTNDASCPSSFLCLQSDSATPQSYCVNPVCTSN